MSTNRTPVVGAAAAMAGTVEAEISPMRTVSVPAKASNRGRRMGTSFGEKLLVGSTRVTGG
jgi:hypothetical protein